MNVETSILKDVSERLDRAQLPYFLSGSMALLYHAQPRYTRDIDIVIDLEPGDAKPFVALFSPDYLVSEESVADAINNRRMFNALHKKELMKVDFIIRKKTLFHHYEFARRKRVTISGFETWIISKEDLIVAKMTWAKESMSETQLGDIKNLIATGADMNYVKDWVGKLGLEIVFSKATK